MADEKTERALTPEELDKVKAEAEKARAEARKFEAEAAKARADMAGQSEKDAAEAAKIRAEARKNEADARTAELAAHKADMEIERETHKRLVELTADEFHYTYRFLGSVSDDSCGKAMDQFKRWERIAAAAYDKGERDRPEIDVDMIINSPGGGIFAGFALVDYIDGMHGRGHSVNITAYGMAASMGGVILQAGKKRLMGPSAHILIHEASFSASGSTANVEDELELVHLLQDRILDMYAARAEQAGKAGTASNPMSRRVLKGKWQRKDWWISAQDSVRYGFVDGIA